MLRKLREVEKYNLSERKEYKTVSPKVEYHLTDFGRYFAPIISQFQELEKKYKKKTVAVVAIE